MQPGIPATTSSTQQPKVEPPTADELRDLPNVILGVLSALGLAYVIARVLARLLRLGLGKLVGRTGEPLSAAVLTPVRLVRRATFLLLAVVFIVPALEIAGIPLHMGLRRDQLLAWVLGSGVRIVAIAIVAWLLIRLVRSLVLNFERDIGTGRGLDALERGRRVRTLGTLVSNGLSVVISAAATLMVLNELNVNILPLLTGAGVVGLAIGFGAQTLVKDIISGFFIIMENQVRVGDVAIINGQGGLVEAITLRTIVLRDTDGTVYMYPNGSITTLANRTKDFSYAVLDLTVAYDQDLDRVTDLLKQIGEEMRADPAFRSNILEPLEVLGVESLGENGIGLRARLKAVPLKQWEVAREFRRRIKSRFAQEGIELQARRTVYLGQPGTATRPDAVPAVSPVTDDF